MEGVGFRGNMVVRHAPLVRRSLAKFLRSQTRVQAIHAFGIWGCVAVRVAGDLRAAGMPIPGPVVSAYTSLRDEYEAKWRGVARWHGSGAWLHAARELAWFRVVVARYERAAFRGSRLVLVNYESVRKRLEADFGADLPIRMVPYSSETAFLPEPARRERTDLPRLPAGNAPLIVAISRHDPRKGVDVLLRALALLRSRHVPFRAALLGTGLLLESHRRLAARLGLEGLVAIEGFVPEAFPYLQIADAFVLPSLQEGSGSLSLIEALQAGVPGVVSDVDGIPEDTGPDRGALLVKPGDEGALALALERLLLDPGLRSAMASDARRHFERRFSPEAFASALGELYADSRAAR